MSSPCKTNICETNICKQNTCNTNTRKARIWFNQFVIIAATAGCLLWVAGAQATEDIQSARIIVTGQGSASVAPDMAILALTVTREADTAQAALKAGSAAMAEVLAAMKKAGIAERDLQTSGFSIQPRYSRPSSKPVSEMDVPRIVGYTVRNALTVKVRDIDDVGIILDKSVSLGVNEGGNINFTNDDPSVTVTQARMQAMKDAASKATTLAETAGVKVGKILEISEQSYYPRPVAASMMRMSASDGAASEAVPIAAGENTYNVTVNVSYAIDQ